MLITLFSASGAPGVSTTALGLALTWERPVILVEADTASGSTVLAGFFQGRRHPQLTTMDLIMAHRGDHLEQTVVSESMRLTDETDPERRVITANPSPLQTRALEGFWSDFAYTFASLERAGIDVIVDAGRLGTDGFALPLVATSDCAVLVTTAYLPQIVAARGAVQARLRPVIPDEGATNPMLHVLVRTAPRSYGAVEASKAVRLPLIGAVPDDPTTAASLSRGEPRSRRFDRSPLTRQLRSLTLPLSTAAATRRREIVDLKGGTAR